MHEVVPMSCRFVVGKVAKASVGHHPKIATLSFSSSLIDNNYALPLNISLVSNSCSHVPCCYSYKGKGINPSKSLSTCQTAPLRWARITLLLKGLKDSFNSFSERSSFSSKHRHLVPKLLCDTLTSLDEESSSRGRRKGFKLE